MNPNARIIKSVMRLSHPVGTGMKENPRSAPKARITKPVMRSASSRDLSMKEPRSAPKARIIKPVMRPSLPGGTSMKEEPRNAVIENGTRTTGKSQSF